MKTYCQKEGKKDNNFNFLLLLILKLIFTGPMKIKKSLHRRKSSTSSVWFCYLTEKTHEPEKCKN